MSSLKYLSQRAAQAIDVELMSPTGGGFGFEQLVELGAHPAGFSVAQAITKVYNKDQFPAVAVFSGPGNNGLDGLVAARHLAHFGYKPRVYYPKRADKPVNKGLMRQCELLDIPFVESPDAGLQDADLVIDAIFGFSFSGEVREPFRGAIGALSKTSLPIVSVDIPSAWDVEKGDIEGNGLLPSMLVSLTAPKQGAQHFQGIHYLGGRFINKHMDVKWGLNLPDFPGTDQCVRLSPTSETQRKTSVREKMDDHFLHDVASQSLF